MWQFPSEMTAPGCGGALCKMEGCAPGGGGTLIYFSCEDCAVEESRAAGAGGQVFRPKWAIGEYGFISLILDTEGNMIGLHSLK
jgi:predicted enzyme related to lactoylglutathione lyase